MAADASACAKPTTVGTLTCGGPLDTTRFTADPEATGIPAFGLWLITLPAAIELLDC